MADGTPEHPRRPTLRERVERNAAIARRRAEGATIRQLADEFGLAKATVSKALREAAEVAPAGPVEALDLGEIVGAGLRAHRVALDRVEGLLDSENPNAVAAAANSISRLVASFVSTLRALGAIGDPDFERERLRIGVEVREVAERMAEAVRGFERAVGEVEGAPPELAEAAAEVVATFERLLADPPPVLAGPLVFSPGAAEEALGLPVRSERVGERVPPPELVS
jgi:transposase-like protein